MAKKVKTTRAKAKPGDKRIGNKFWEVRAKSGRYKIFSSSDEFREAAFEYFTHIDNNPWIKKEALKGGQEAGRIIDVPTQRPYTIVGLCVFLGITHQTFLNYEKDSNYKEFFEVFTCIREIIEQNQIEGASTGSYSHTIIARLLGLKEQVENTNIEKEEIDLSKLSEDEKIAMGELRLKAKGL